MSAPEWTKEMREHQFTPRLVWREGREVDLREDGERVCGFITSGASYSGALDGTNHCGAKEGEHSMSDPKREQLEAEANLAESERMHDEVRAICAEAGVHHPRVLLVKLARIEQRLSEGQGNQPWCSCEIDLEIVREERADAKSSEGE